MAAEFEPTLTQALAWARLRRRLLDYIADVRTKRADRAEAKRMLQGLADLIQRGPPKPGRQKPGG